MNVEAKDLLAVHYQMPGAPEVLLVFSFGKEPADFTAVLPPGEWKRLLDSADAHWGGKGPLSPARLPAGECRIAPRSALVYVN